MWATKHSISPASYGITDAEPKRNSTQSKSSYKGTEKLPQHKAESDGGVYELFGHVVDSTFTYQSDECSDTHTSISDM